MGISTSKKIVKMGFNLKMVNPETRDVIASKIFRVQSKTGSSVSLNGFSSSEEDPAVAAVMEDGVIQAISYMAHVRDSLNITSQNIPGNVSKDPNAANDIEIDLSNANFSSFNALASILPTMTGYKSMEKSFSSGSGTFTVNHTGSADSFLDELNKKVGDKYEITGFDSGKIQLKAK